MLKKLLWVLGAIVIIFAAFTIYGILTTKKHSPAETVTYAADQINISVDYCRPYKKGREIFGDLLPYDAYWRTGANEPTIIKFSKDVKFGGQLVREGSYRLYTIPKEKTWTVVLNSELDKWGYWEPKPELDVVRVVVDVFVLKDVKEQFQISLPQNENGVELVMEWDRTGTAVSITF